MTVAETVARNSADSLPAAHPKRPLRGRILQFLALTALPAGIVLAQAAKEPARDPSNPVETEAGIPIKDALVVEKCGTCHTADAKGNLSRISYVRTTPEGWAQVIRRMSALNGLSLTPVEARAVIRSLSATNGLAPEEAKPVAYFAEHRIISETSIPNETIRQSCAACHAFAQPLSWRRSKAEWSLLRNLHVAMYSQADAQFRKPVEDPTQPTPPNGALKPLPVEVAMEYLNKTAPLTTPEWTKWQARQQSAKLGGKWLVNAFLPGKGTYVGEMVVTPAGGEDDYTTAITLKSLADGSTLSRSGKGLVYTGYSWRGTSASGAEGATPDAPADHETRETMQFAPDRKSAEGRWFWGDYKEFGFNVKLTRASAEPTVSAVWPYALKAGSKGATLKLIGDAFPASLKPSDIDLGKGVTVSKVVSASPTEAVLMVDVAADAAVGAHDVGLGGSVLAAGLPVYKKVDYLKVTPETAIARLGGSEKHTPGYQQFDAIGYDTGIDGKPYTTDDVALGPIDVTWSMQEMPTVYYDDDVNYVGKLSQTALFTPAIDGPNPERKWGRNNYGEVWVVATAKAEKDALGRPLTAKSFMVVTVPAYKRWDQPEVAK
ncbi:MAG: quinohemoprotein amine dehydrogenase subunit alpha [Novosphingobium sp. 17-62-19]|uniref:quinohemoprotein amine dehydrogenase subunit alpha n=1 Tax=Novosphingobium sp. 17-62-19 TaxID=1970406 RepID=UPI000BD61F2C|nr:quinohemoprotein amine dehydrogenase subunit alpha [Novosphingobium sp. 17-62-19]OZA21066.1 MAG: quinohemoprotein amine dehydrogenase subunit alpha [Novosphingobium sp. 17-62-19]HQS97370.1 quinohemoprotein amine dehydrogenase subunit alpha [Novosphingobium sp.]